MVYKHFNLILFVYILLIHIVIVGINIKISYDGLKNCYNVSKFKIKIDTNVKFSLNL
jgi:hypothetical protein